MGEGAGEVEWLVPQLQGAEGAVVQSGQWLEGVVVEGPLGLGVGVLGAWVGAERPLKVQGVVDQNGPCYPPPEVVWGAGSLLEMAVGAALDASSPAAQPPARPGPQ